MDYEKKYKEALEWARKVMQGKVGFVLDEVLEKFPELKESEDEMIRKALIDFFSEPGRKKYILNGFTVDDILAWLEKQTSNVDNANKEYWRGYREGKQEILDKYAELEKQGEQKATIIIPKFRVGDEIKTSDEESLTVTKIDEKGYWSEDLFICGFDDAAKWELVEQKTAWSEEDETALGDALWCCKQAASIAKDENDMGNIWYAEKWLKSLRPQSTWKPSDEHYELEEFAKIVRCNLTGISKAVQELFKAKYLQLTGNKMYGGFKD